MHVTKLSLRDFRNYERLDLQIGPHTTLLYGPNAAGKTSVLEALFYLATTKSTRAGADRELVRWDAVGEAGVPPFARLVCEIQRRDAPTRLEVIVQRRADEEGQLTAGSQKIVRINKKQMRALDLVGQLRVVLFTPADLSLVEGAPSERRRYLDVTLSQLDGRYVRTLSHYGKILQQRNSLLRAWRERRRPPRSIDDELAFWDEELTNAGGYVLSERLRAVQELNQLAGPIFPEITAGTHPLLINYQSSFELEEATSELEVCAVFRKQLKAMRREELARGQTLIGPHRDDLLFTVNDVNLGVFGSRGQQRSVTLALKLGEGELMRARTLDAPVLLLDDMLSELDSVRRAHLLRAIGRPDQQTILTATGMEDFDASFLSTAKRMRVEEGHVYQA
jgi:DNA replication and repair protein RecF